MTTHSQSDLLGGIDFPFRLGHHYEVDPETGCWNWLLFKQRGYAKTGYGRAYKDAYEALRGPVPPGYDVHHACRNPGCINPDHLEAVDRSAHRRAHGRARSSLTPGQVVSIRERAYEGEGLFAMSVEFGLTHKAIQNIVKGVKWADVGGPVGRPAPRHCRECGVLIEGRRRHATFCSPGHRSTYNCRKRKARLAAQQMKVAA